jgi:nitronate monooxygenase
MGRLIGQIAATRIRKDRPMWPDRRLLDLFKIEVPIVQAPMAGAIDTELAVAVAKAGGLGSLPCAMLTPDKAREQVNIVRQQVAAPVNLNFFAHTPTAPEPARVAAWRERLAPYYEELGLDPGMPVPMAARAPFDAAMCALVEELKPEVVSFHFGLPEAGLLARVKAAGSIVIASATTVEEGRWLAARGVQAIIAQGAEAGGHRSMFLTDDVATQSGTFALVPQMADAVDVPVIAAGGIADGRGIAAAFALGASVVQLGTAYLRTPESKVSAIIRARLAAAGEATTAITNVMTGRAARGVVNRAMAEIGPVTAAHPGFPHAAAAFGPLKAAAEKLGRADFTNVWAGQAVALGRDTPAEDLTRALADDARRRLAALAG